MARRAAARLKCPLSAVERTSACADAGEAVAARRGHSFTSAGTARPHFLLRARTGLRAAPRPQKFECPLHDEIVTPDTAIRSGRQVKQESLIEQPVSLIEWLAREVELSREEPAARPLHLEMIVPGAPRISGRNDCVEPPTTLVIDGLMATKPESSIVIPADVIRMPDLEE